MKKLLLEICKEHGYKDPPNKSGITIEMLIDGCIEANIVEYVRQLTGCAKATVTRAISNSFPDRDPIHDRSISRFLLRKRNLQHCASCSTIKPLEEFYLNSSKLKGVSDVCKECNRFYRKESYAKNPSKERIANDIRKKRMHEFQVPAWADLDQIKEIYLNCPLGHQVDHIVPLNGELVSGLHVENNLQYLTTEDNLSKKNRYHV